ncbi:MULTISPECIES: class I SAM-dependent methyltransferase [Burkholderia]|uniref:class I SAM-dependent methyltransferase n=1 Tax=Burkholderia TaxID=32008 RepID=UPI0008416D12|nr:MULTISPECIES: class I SAM-dependent methyltransferase [unclassified Burkholderia]AOK30681.1 hypothetical protein AQ611_15760 [Burkholderia sp. Bp7605]
MNSANQLISHRTGSDHTVESAIATIQARLRAQDDLPAAMLGQQLALVEQLATFEFGRFLLVNRGLDGEWTHRLVTYEPGTLKPGATTDLEYRLFERLPAGLATRERFGVFRRELQALLKPGITLASVPCGWMGDLLLLDHSGYDDIKLLGIDLDPRALDGAWALATERGLTDRLSLRRGDAWSLGLHAQVDALTSNGLNIYEPDEDRVIALYRRFFDALKPGGHLITSFLTPPPALSDESPWDLSVTTPDALALQQTLFVHVLGVKWNVFRTHAQTRTQLERAGFAEIRFADDRGRMFPTVVARKPV